jgi:hypothetical protein
MHSVEYYNMLRNLTVYKHHLGWSEKLNQGECYGLAFARTREKQEIHTVFLWENVLEMATRVI